VSDIDKCAQLKGTLIADQSAQMISNLAVDMRKDYWKKCQADFDQEYCNQLIQRAVAIELRKPRTSE
jgi:predicted outer membrane protein